MKGIRRSKRSWKFAVVAMVLCTLAFVGLVLIDLVPDPTIGPLGYVIISGFCTLTFFLFYLLPGFDWNPFTGWIDRFERPWLRAVLTVMTFLVGGAILLFVLYLTTVNLGE